MPHRIYEIKNLMGEADNQPSRLTDRPTLVRGRYTRVGGVSLPPNISQSTDSSFVNLYGYDWLGGYAIDYGANLFMGYSQASSSATHSKLGSFTEYYPGVASIHFDDDRLLPVGATYLAPDGSIAQIDGSCTNLQLLPYVGGNDWPSNFCVTVMGVFFVRGLYGWIPFSVVVDSMTNTSEDFGVSVQYGGTGCASCSWMVKLYVAYKPWADYSCRSGGSAGDTRFNESKRWFLWKEKVFDEPNYIAIDFLYKDDVGEPNSAPTFYIGVDHSATRYSKYATYAVARTFHASKNEASVSGEQAVAYQLLYSCYRGCGSGNWSVKHVFCVSKNRVYYSDSDYIGYSDAIDPQSIKLSDQIDAVVPSVRGIYAASTTAIYEAFGDFETLDATGVSLVPIVAGVDDAAIANATFSGDVAYFVKRDEVYRLGPGGKEVMGVQVHRPGVGVYAINYDRYGDRLLVVTTDGELLTYDVTRKAWLTLHGSVPLGVPIVTRPRYQFRIDDMIYTESGAGHIRLEFEKLDFKLPGVRKRVHTIRVPYLGDLRLSAGIRAPGGPWRTGVVIQRNGYFEVRFPSVVSSSFDLYLDAFSPSNNIGSAINPPIVITYEVREKLYAQE